MSPPRVSWFEHYCSHFYMSSFKLIPCLTRSMHAGSLIFFVTIKLDIYFRSQNIREKSTCLLTENFFAKIILDYHEFSMLGKFVHHDFNQHFLFFSMIFVFIKLTMRVEKALLMMKMTAMMMTTNPRHNFRQPHHKLIYILIKICLKKSLVTL